MSVAAATNCDTLLVIHLDYQSPRRIVKKNEKAYQHNMASKVQGTVCPRNLVYFYKAPWACSSLSYIINEQMDIRQHFVEIREIAKI